MSSSSSDSDEDYVPAGEESDEDVEEPHEGRMRVANRKKTKRKRGFEDDSSEELEERISPRENEDSTRTVTKENEKDRKKKADDLWAAFKKDANVPKKSAVRNSVAVATTRNTNQTNEKPKDDKMSQLFGDTVEKPSTKTYNFAGEDIQVKECPDEKPNPSVNKRQGSSLSSLVGQLGKKPKMGTLQKSKLDWEAFKTSAGIAEELQQHNKDGYLEKQDFLARTDWRQFERERDIRLKSAKKLP